MSLRECLLLDDVAGSGATAGCESSVLLVTYSATLMACAISLPPSFQTKHLPHGCGHASLCFQDWGCCFADAPKDWALTE